VKGPTPLLDCFRRGEVARDVRLLAAQGELAPRAHEQLALLVLLLDDADPEIRRTADDTLGRIPAATLAAFLARSDVPSDLQAHFAGRGIRADETAALGPADGDPDQPLIDTAGAPSEPLEGGEGARKSLMLGIAEMSFTDRLKAALKGTREMRALLIRDTNKMIAAAVLSSPKLTDSEIESFARMANVGDEVLRVIGNNRTWTKHYGVVVGLTKNPKTPVAVSMNLMARLNARDLLTLSVDRNVPEPLRIAARKRVAAGTSRK
jgi:hypothetical protein